jgi:Tol biopolymer transport system component
MSVLDWPILRDLSPDGKTLLIEEEGDGGGANYSVYLRKMDTPAAVRLGEGRAVALSPDSQWAITRAANDDAAPLLLLPTGAGQSRPVTHDNLLHYDAHWFPDGKRVLCICAEKGHLPRDYILAVDTGDVQPLTPEGTIGKYVSPDGDWVAVTDMNKKLSLWPVAGGAPRPLNVDMSGQIVAGWTGDGKGLYIGYEDKDVSKQSDVDLLDIATGKRTLWKKVLPADANRTNALEYVPRFSSDGKTYAYSFSRWQSELELLEGLK